MTTATTTTVDKLTALRQQMADYNLDFYYVPSSDAHQDEYVPEVWQRRQWISGFTGSAGDVLVGKDEAYLWTDGRYVLQAEQELDMSEFKLMAQLQGVAAPIDEWLVMQGGVRVGVDPRVMSIAQMDRFQAALSETGGELVSIDDNLVDAIRNEDLSLPATDITLWSVEYAGISAKQKIEHVQQYLQEMECDAVVLNTLDAIAWLYNIRGNDIDFNPVCISYAMITADKAHLFVSGTKVTEDVTNYLREQEIQCHDYVAIGPELQQFKGELLLMDPSAATWWMLQQVENTEVAFAPGLIDMMKACKNPIEQDGMREAHRVDGIALCRFMHWLENNWQQGVTELSCADKLAEFRAQGKNFKGLSFNTISGFADHGAIIHYAVSKETDQAVDDSNMYLLDSGGQYLDGTTDVTRTMHLGEPTLKQKQLYTAVLQGHIALSKLRFPQGTHGGQLDTLARQFIWQQQWDYAHGTGHGVGCYLCVHEGPQRVSRGGPATQVPLVDGMVISNEPGVYLPDEFGIRIENLCLIKECDQQADNGFGPFLQLETLTLAPYVRKLIAVEQLSADEVQWLNAYHQRVYDTLSPDLGDAEVAWLKQATMAV
ncbi:MAG: aminopeptidase P family protein [Coxiellaceae bacterium]|nr:aminopeptidase P family protein [Coxiellaceae bacterium]